MTTAEKIKNNPYLKAENCTDLSDVEYGIQECKNLINTDGNTTRLCVILSKLMAKKEKLEAKASTSNLHPIFAEALKPFGIK